MEWKAVTIYHLLVIQEKEEGKRDAWLGVVHSTLATVSMWLQGGHK